MINTRRLVGLLCGLCLMVLMVYPMHVEAAEYKQFEQYEIAENEYMAEALTDETADDTVVEISDEEVPLAIDAEAGPSPLIWVFVGVTGAVAGSIYLKIKSEE